MPLLSPTSKMFETALSLALLCLSFGISKGQNPSMTVLTNTSSSSCSEQYLVAGKDHLTFEVELTGNGSIYTYDESYWPQFILQTWGKGAVKICQPFDLPGKGFCKKSQQLLTLGTIVCSCEMVRSQVYRVKVVYKMTDVSESSGIMLLLWPSKRKGLNSVGKYFHFPHVRPSKPHVEVVRSVASFACSDQYLVVGVDTVTFELELYGNISSYFKDDFYWPQFTFQTNGNEYFLCEHLTHPRKEFCVKENQWQRGCSCEVVGPQVYRVQIVYEVHHVQDSKGIIQFKWPSVDKSVHKAFHLPEVRAEKPSVEIVKSVSSSLCSDKYLVTFVDTITFELELSGNNSLYTYEKHSWPRFRLQELKNGTSKIKSSRTICEPFSLPENGFCKVKQQLNFRQTGCYCETVGPQVYRVKAIYNVRDVSESRGRIELYWPSTVGTVGKVLDIPDVMTSLPSVKVLKRKLSFLCSKQYLVVGMDSVTFELEVSGNYSMYTYEEWELPEIRMQKWRNGSAKLGDNMIVCMPFTSRENGFCVKGDFCSCEEVSPQVYHVKIVYKLRRVDESRGRLSLSWDLRISKIREYIYLPEVKALSTETCPPKPVLEIVRAESFFLCDHEVVTEGAVVLEVDVSGNNSDYSLNKYVWPMFYRETVGYTNQFLGVTDYKPICAPFTTPESGFCVNRRSCSCEEIRPQVYRVNVTYLVENAAEPLGRLSLIWPSINDYIEVHGDVPDIKNYCLNSNRPAFPQEI
ncbi:hypothetical protein PoB_006619600 [Plakobranchus ocellatus]|uniref:Uncharacterized protein n=1 Tax=Plakobranchus ocellatus TaxID=259542 RepID=A0AAV4D6W5_9GAST|nr:hypothetical protein PoB_006619600 [Plakobranchus ocellatus]